MTIQASNFPTVMPALTLDLTRSQYLDPRITFARASIGTFVDSRGILQTAPSNVARFDHNPTTGESLGLLVEEPRTNLLVRSEEFNNASWNPQSTAPTVTANTAISPSGTLTADTITFAAADSRLQSDLIAVTAGVSYTFSVYVKAVGVSLNKCRLAFFDGAQQNSADFTISDLTWTRISNTFVAASTTSARVQIRNATDVLANSLFFWGAQLEAGAFPTSYILNVNTPLGVTRSADVVQITGTAFSGWYRQDEGTIYHQGRTPTAANFFSIDDGTVDNRITSYMPATTAPAFFVGDSGVTQANISSSAITTGSMFAQASVYKAADFVIVTNGGTVSTDTSGSVPTVNRMVIGTNNFALANINGTIRRLVFWPQRLPNSTLQALTSS